MVLPVLCSMCVACILHYFRKKIRRITYPHRMPHILLVVVLQCTREYRIHTYMCVCLYIIAAVSWIRTFFARAWHPKKCCLSALSPHPTTSYILCAIPLYWHYSLLLPLAHPFLFVLRHRRRRGAAIQTDPKGRQWKCVAREREKKKEKKEKLRLKYLNTLLVCDVFRSVGGYGRR